MSSLLSPAATPLDVDDLLAEILLRLPPVPSSLPRASAVCKRWRLLASNPRFLRRFRIHHRRNPPLLGFFVKGPSSLFFVPTMEGPNRVPPGRLSLQIDHDHCFQPLGCRHGLALISDQKRQKFIVCDPITGDQHQLATPWFDPRNTNGVNRAVLRAAGDVHFQVVFVATGTDDTQAELRALAYVYSSVTGLWGDLISTAIPLEPDSGGDLSSVFHSSVCTTPSVLVGDSLYWQLRDEDNFTVARADGGGLGLLFVLDSSAKLWERNTDCDGVASWVLGRTIKLDKLHSLDSEVQRSIIILGFAEENNMVFLWTGRGFF